MEILVRRIAKKEKYTIGKLYIDGKYVCDTIEDKDRGLTQNMSVSYIKSHKVYGETAIPIGRYKVDMNTVSPKYSNPNKYKWAKKYGAKLPRLVDVPGFSGVLLHTGTTASDSCGCLIVGKNKAVGKVLDSVKTFYDLMDNYLVPARDRKEEIWITIE